MQIRACICARQSGVMSALGERQVCGRSSSAAPDTNFQEKEFWRCGLTPHALAVDDLPNPAFFHLASEVPATIAVFGPTTCVTQTSMSSAVGLSRNWRELDEGIVGRALPY